MSIIAAAVRHLMAAGVTGEDLIAAIADMEAAQPKDTVAEKRRAYDRERKRAAKAANSGGIPVDSADSTENPLSRPPNENNSNPPTHTPGYITPARKGCDFPMLDCADPETWADFLRNRKAKRLPNTASAHRKLESDLAAMVARTGWPPGKVFSACVAKGWGAIYDPRDKNDGSKTIRDTGGDRRSSLARAIDEGLEWLDGTQAGVS